MSMCEVCDSIDNLQEHHTSYTPEILQTVCVGCHIKIHGHGVGRPIGYVYTRRVDIPGKRVPYRYRVRKAGGKSTSLEVTIPNVFFMDTINQHGMTRKEGVKKLEAVWRYNGFELNLSIEPIENSEG